MKNQLTDLDKRMIELIAHGLTTKAMSDALKISKGNVEQERHRLFKKCEVGNAPELVHWAYQHGILKVVVGTFTISGKDLYAVLENHSNGKAVPY